jgi:hypothetical protein
MHLLPMGRDAAVSQFINRPVDILMNYPMLHCNKTIETVLMEFSL